MSSSKPKRAASHPKYIDMIVNAVKALCDKNGSSRQAINKYIVKEYNLRENNHHNAMLKQALIRGSGSNGPLLHNKGKGAAGSFKIKATLAKPDKKPTKTASAKKKVIKKASTKKNSGKAEAKPKKQAVKQPEAKPVVSEPGAGKPTKTAKTVVSKKKTTKKSKVSTPKKPKVVKAAKKSPKKPAKKSGAPRK